MREIKVSNFSDFCNSFQSLAAENWKERRPNEVLALGMISEIYLLERVSSMKTAAQYCLLSMAVMISFRILSVAEVHP